MHSEAGIDWLAATIPANSPNYTKVLLIARKEQENEAKEGNTLKAASILGYEGAICGSIFVGERYEDAMVRFTSTSANEAIKRLKGQEIKVSRIDLQVTVWFDENPAEIIRQYYGMATAEANVADKRTVKTVRKVESNDGGYTVYIGSRSSQSYGRIYDKFRESKDEVYKNALRYEVELKADKAKAAFKALSRRNSLQASSIASFVGEWFTGRGINVPFLYKNGLLVVEAIRRDKSDTHRRLEWLRTQVRHTCLELRKTVDSTVILEVLGFFEQVNDDEGRVIESKPPIEP